MHWQPLSVHLWAYCTHPPHDVNDVMCEGLLFLFSFSPFFCSLFFNHERKRKAYVYVGPNMYRITFVFTLVSHRVDRARILGVRNKKACFIIIVPRENNMPYAYAMATSVKAVLV